MYASVIYQQMRIADVLSALRAISPSLSLFLSLVLFYSLSLSLFLPFVVMPENYDEFGSEDEDV